MNESFDVESIDTVIVGSGQSGLSVGYHLAREGLDFLILEGNERVGDNWRKRWDSLRLFTPAQFNSLPGMRFPAPRHYFPTKDEMADYLEEYAARFGLPLRTGVRVERLWREGERFRLLAGGRCLEADQVVVAMANYQKPKVPDLASELEPEIVQLHSSEYRGPSQLKPGPVLVVGAGNSGAEIAVELSHEHETWLAGRSTGEIPFDINGWAGRHGLVRLVLRVLFHRVLSVATPIGRKLRPKIISHGGPLIRTKFRQLEAAGVTHLPAKVTGVKDGLPELADGTVVKASNVIWCTGYRPGFSWIDLPGFGDDPPEHQRGVIASQPGLYFVGLHFLYSLSSAMVHAAARDGRHAARLVSLNSKVAREPADPKRTRAAAAVPAAGGVDRPGA